MKTLKLLLLLIITCVPFNAFSQQYWNVPGYTESFAKRYLNESSNLNQIEGIWQTSDGSKYAIERSVEYGYRQKDKYRVIVLESSMRVWKLGEIKGFITHGSDDNIYSYKYYLKNLTNGQHSGTQTVFLLMESPTLAKYSYKSNDLGGKKHVIMYKLYPKNTASSNNTTDNTDNTINTYAAANNTSSTRASKWSGTGFFLSENGYIVTNQHVIDGAKTIKVANIDGNRNTTYKASVEISDKQNDLAIIKITDDFTQPSPIPYSFKFTTSSIGENCWALGYPSTQTTGGDIKLTNGVISSRSGFEGNIAQYQISAPVQSGDSGGPLFDNDGNLIGIVQTKQGAVENAGYAVKASYVNNLIDMLPTPITIPQTNQLSGKSLTQQVELASKCVVLILCE